MFTWSIDLGQLIISALIGLVGWFVKRTIDEFKDRIDKHDNILFKLVGDVQRLIGYNEGWNGQDRRKIQHEKNPT